MYTAFIQNVVRLSKLIKENWTVSLKSVPYLYCEISLLNMCKTAPVSYTNVTSNNRLPKQSCHTT